MKGKTLDHLLLDVLRMIDRKKGRLEKRDLARDWPEKVHLKVKGRSGKRKEKRLRRWSTWLECVQSIAMRMKELHQIEGKE